MPGTTLESWLLIFMKGQKKRRVKKIEKFVEVVELIPLGLHSTVFFLVSYQSTGIYENGPRASQLKASSVGPLAREQPIPGSDYSRDMNPLRTVLLAYRLPCQPPHDRAPDSTTRLPAARTKKVRLQYASGQRQTDPRTGYTPVDRTASGVAGTCYGPRYLHRCHHSQAHFQNLRHGRTIHLLPS